MFKMSLFLSQTQLRTRCAIITDQKSFYSGLEGIALIFIITQNVYFCCELFRHFFLIVVESLSCVQLFATSWTAACQASLSFTIPWNLLKLMSIESVTPPNNLIFCCPFSSCLQYFPA